MRVALFVACVLLAIVTLPQCCDNSTAPDVPNHAPIFVEIPVQVVEEGFRLQFVVEASDSDGTVPALSVKGAPANSVAVDSGNGKMVFVFEPDLSQSGVYFVIFEASDGRATSSLVVTIEVDPNRLADTWPMAVGNYWVFEARGWGESNWVLDSIHVDSCYETDQVIHCRLSKGFRFLGNDLTVRNDSIIGIWHSIAMPASWREQPDTVPAGVFPHTFWSWQVISAYYPYTESFVFAKGVGVIKYGWSNGTPHNPDYYEARLLRYRVK